MVGKDVNSVIVPSIVGEDGSDVLSFVGDEFVSSVKMSVDDADVNVSDVSVDDKVNVKAVVSSVVSVEVKSSFVVSIAGDVDVISVVV